MRLILLAPNLLPVLFATLAPPALAQGMDPNMPGMDMGNSRPGDPAEGSGTARLPANEGAMRGAHLMAGDWMVMAHASVSGQFTQDTGPRGDDKLYVTSMAMAMAGRDTAWGHVQLKSMFSMEPLMDASGYPSLFSTGETAHGAPIVDRQHPHNFFMELAGRVDVNLGLATRGFIYGGPVAEPALGPSAFMHRASAQYNPDPPITHHYFDSTHISFGVVTAGLSGALAGRHWQLETSAFRGQEPDEKRWGIGSPRLDSWSVRATLNPGAALAIQASYGQIPAPEATHPDENEHRFTASAHYASRPSANGGGLSAMAGFSAKTRVATQAAPGRTLTAWLGEGNWNIDRHNTLFSRIENVANDELFPATASPLHDQAFRVTKMQIGYARRMMLGRVELAPGGSVAAYAKPAALDGAYGRHPMGYTLFVRASLAQ